MTQTQSLARQQPQEMARPTKELSLQDVAEMTGYELPQIAMIRHNMATSMNMPPDRVPLYDLALYCHSARELDLDPLLRQCYWISRQGKGALQVGIDGYRAIAERSGIYAGSQPPEFRDWHEITHENRTILVPGLARITVWKIIAGRSCAFTGEAYWDEWYPGAGRDGFMYRKMPRHMLAKDAEAQALRKAFPAMLSKVEYAAAIGDGTDVGAPAIEVYEERPAPRPRTAAEYDRTLGAADWGERSPTARRREPESDGEEGGAESGLEEPTTTKGEAQQQNTRSQERKRRVGESNASTSSPDSAPEPTDPDTEMVNDYSHPLWEEWRKAVKLAHAQQIEVPALDLPQSVRALRAAIASLLEAVDDATGPSQGGFA